MYNVSLCTEAAECKAWEHEPRARLLGFEFRFRQPTSYVVCGILLPLLCASVSASRTLWGFHEAGRGPDPEQHVVYGTCYRNIGGCEDIPWVSCHCKVPQPSPSQCPTPSHQTGAAGACSCSTASGPRWPPSWPQGCCAASWLWWSRSPRQAAGSRRFHH